MATPDQPIVLGDTGRLTPETVRTLQETQTTATSLGAFTPSNWEQQQFNGAYERYKAGVPSGTVYNGGGSNGDDGPTATKSQDQAIMKQASNVKITPQPNVLDRYASYTYCLSWYVLTPDQFSQLQSTLRGDTAQWSLLAQSGGAPAGAGGDGNRNKYFQLDYYLDNLELVSNVFGKGTGSVHNAMGIKFDILEPSGITLVRNLASAYADLCKQTNTSSEDANMVAAQYCMVIKFYGYDDKGELVKAGNTKQGIFGGATSNPAIVQKFIPFTISEIAFKASSRGHVEYNIGGTITPYDTALGASRGSIPFELELVGQTVGDILSGKSNDVKAEDNDGRKDGPRPNSNLGPNDNNNINDGRGEG